MRILVDTSIWRRHFRTGDPRLVGWLRERRVVAHQEVLEELLLGGIAASARHSLLALPRVAAVPPADVIRGIDTFRLARRGIGAIDLHVFLAAHVAGVALYTADAALALAFGPFQPPGFP